MTSTIQTKNPNDSSARSIYEAVVTDVVGTYQDAPARIALYGTRYASLEVERDGRWAEEHSVAFGGIRGTAALRDYLDVPVAPSAAQVQEDDAIDETLSKVLLKVDTIAKALVDVIERSAEPVAKVVAEKDANPPSTLDEVRTAYESEAKGACRPAVLRALRVRAGELALGLPVASAKAPRAQVTQKLAREVVVDGTKARAGDVEALRAVLARFGEKLVSNDEQTEAVLSIPTAYFSVDLGFPSTASEKGNHWRYDRPGVKAAAALGYSVEFDGRAKVIHFRRPTVGE